MCRLYFVAANCILTKDEDDENLAEKLDKVLPGRGNDCKKGSVTRYCDQARYKRFSDATIGLWRLKGHADHLKSRALMNERLLLHLRWKCATEPIFSQLVSKTVISATAVFLFQFTRVWVTRRRWCNHAAVLAQRLAYQKLFKNVIKSFSIAILSIR